MPDCLIMYQSASDIQECVQVPRRLTEYSSPEEASGDGKTHANLSVRQWEHLGTVCERHRALTRRVECAKKEDKQSNQSEAQFRLGSIVVYEGAETGGQERPGHLGESEKEERAATELKGMYSQHD